MFETFRLLRKSLKLRRLSKILGRELDYKTFLKELKDNERTDALEDLLDLCESDNAGIWTLTSDSGSTQSPSPLSISGASFSLTR